TNRGRHRVPRAGPDIRLLRLVAVHGQGVPGQVTLGPLSWGKRDVLEAHAFGQAAQDRGGDDRDWLQSTSPRIDSPQVRMWIGSHVALLARTCSRPGTIASRRLSVKSCPGVT